MSGAPHLRSPLAGQIPPEFGKRLSTWEAPASKPPRIFWSDSRGWRFWLWFAVMVAGGAVDLVVIIGAAAGR